MIGGNQFIRQYKLTVGDYTFESDDKGEGLQIVFGVEHAFTTGPNNAEIDLFNASRDTREYLESAGGVGVRLEAGYVGNTDVVFYGTLRHCENADEGGVNKVSRMSAGDSEIEYLTATVERQWSEGTPVAVVLQDLVTATALKPGNVATIAPLAMLTRKKDGEILAQSPVLTSPYAVAGKAFEVMRKFMQQTNLRWTALNGEFYGGQEGLPTTAGVPYIISPATGQVGSIRVETTRDEHGEHTIISGRAKLLPGLKLGQILVISSERWSGQIVVHATRHIGDLYGADWDVEFFGEELSL